MSVALRRLGAETPNTDSAPVSRRGRPRAEQSEAIAHRLREAAFRQFLTFGFERASLNSIAQEAGVTRKVIYDHFKDKAGLLSAVMNSREVAFFSETLLNPPPTGTREQRLRTIGTRVLDHFLEPKHVDLWRMLCGGLYRFPELAAQERLVHDRVQRKIAEQLVTDPENPGDFRSELETVRDFMAMITGAGMSTVMGIAPPPPAQEREKIVDRAVRRMLSVA